MNAKECKRIISINNKFIGGNMLPLINKETAKELLFDKLYEVYKLTHQSVVSANEIIEKLSEKDKHEHISMGER